MTPLFCEDLIISASSPVRALDKLAANGLTAYSARSRPCPSARPRLTSIYRQPISRASCSTLRLASSRLSGVRVRNMPALTISGRPKSSWLLQG